VSRLLSAEAICPEFRKVTPSQAAKKLIAKKNSGRAGLQASVYALFLVLSRLLAGGI
jgi:hypothetical protein